MTCIAIRVRILGGVASVPPALGFPCLFDRRVAVDGVSQVRLGQVDVPERDVQRRVSRALLDFEALAATQ